jgi:hypothetical protein
MTGGAAIAPVSGTLTRMCAAAIAALALGLLLACAPATAAPGATGTTALQVSFDAGAKMRLRGQSFTGTGAGAANAVLARHPGVRVARMFDASEADLDARRARLLRAGRRDVPDLNRHYRIVAVDAAQRDRAVRELAALAVVDDARAEPQPAPPRPPATGSRCSATAPPRRPASAPPHSRRCPAAAASRPRSSTSSTRGTARTRTSPRRRRRPRSSRTASRPIRSATPITVRRCSGR